MATLSADQFAQLLATITNNAGQQPAPPPQATAPVTGNDPNALGPMPPCIFDANKMTRLTQFELWLEEAANRMKFIGVTDDDKKVILLRSWGGSELVKFMKTYAKVKFEVTPAAGTTAEVPADTYVETVQKIKAELRLLVNRTMAMHQLFTTKQGDRTWMDFIKVLEDKAHILDFDTTPYTQNDAVKDAAIFGMADERLQEKALAEDPALATLIRLGQSRESGREGLHCLKENISSVSRVVQGDMTIGEIDKTIHNLQVMKVQKQGRYSGRPTRQQKGNTMGCTTCSTRHAAGECRAQGKECFTCGDLNHFSGSQACKGTQRNVRRVQDEASKAEGSYSHTMMNDWPGVKADRKTKVVKLISTLKKVGEGVSTTAKRVKVDIGGSSFTLYTDTGSEFTIIPPSAYKPHMGEVVPADTHLRAWGSATNLAVCGMINAIITTKKGATTNTNVYIVDGFHPEPLLGDKDAESLGFITFNQDGRDPEAREVNRIAQKIRDNLHVTVETTGNKQEEIPAAERQRVEELIESYKGLVFSDEKIGRMDVKPIHLEVDPNFVPVQPQFHNTPLHYREDVSKHLQFLREQGAITDIDPSESKAYDCVMNTVITDKKGGQIRMNIDTRPWNHGMRRTKFHVETPHEIRHELKEAKIFTEMDMGWAYHQLPIDEATKERSIFQSHEGLHRMEVLYFGPKAASGIFHDAVRKKLTGLNGARNIYDNFIVWGRDYDEHYENFKACLERCAQHGIILKTSKTHTCLNKIKWFGRIFTTDGVTVDSDKIEAIVAEGRPENIEDVRSFLMACQYNAKFLFDSPQIAETYEEVTAPLRALLKKDAKFRWQGEQEESYQKLLTLMESPATLRPFKLGAPTHYVADSSEIGIQASIYQVQDGTTWVPVDHISRALTHTEAGYSPIERESLAQWWGMDLFRFYLVGGSFTAWTDHQPLVGIYNNKDKRTSKRIANHRDQVVDLQFNMQHLAGEEMPCDYGSRNPYPIDHLAEDEKEKLGCDTGKMIYVRRIDVSNSPDAILHSDIRTAAGNDATYMMIKKDVLAGKRPSPKVPLGYKRVWEELCVIDGILHKGNKIVLPNGVTAAGSANIRTVALDIAHEGHVGMTETKQYMRSTVWFPGMDKRIEDLVSTCLPCLASTEVKHRDPLIPTPPPPTPWSKLAADHWGPTPDGKYLLVVIDELTRFPEIAVVTSTSADANIEAFDSIFSRHGYPDSLKTDGGPPFNGTDSHLLKQYFRWAGIKHHSTISADDPEANGLAEAAMKHCRKIWHTAIVEKKNPQAEINKHLLKMRTTPHPTTKKAPAELLYNRHIKTRLPQSAKLIGDRPDIKEAIQEDVRVKLQQKAYKDKKSYVKPHQITAGDTVLLKQKSSKRKPPYDPEPYVVTDVTGHQITAERGQQRKTRDAQKWKKVEIRRPTDYRRIREQQRRRELLQHHREDALDITTPQDITPAGSGRAPPPTPEENDPRRPDVPDNPAPTQAPPPRYPRRERNAPSRYRDYVMK